MIRWGVMGGVGRGIGAAAKKERKRNRNITQRQFGKRNLFYSSLHRAVYEGGYLLTPYIT